MAYVKSNDLTEGLSGRFGKMVFRTFRGKTYVAHRPAKPKTESEGQRSTRSRFKQATQYAKQMMSDPERKAYYTRKAKEMTLPNAYTAAITDFMRKPQIHHVEVGNYDGKPGSQITIQASKKDFGLERVSVVVTSPDDVVLEQATAQYTGSGTWIYQFLLTSTLDYPSYKILVTAEDRQGMLCQLMMQLDVGKLSPN